MKTEKTYILCLHYYSSKEAMNALDDLKTYDKWIVFEDKKEAFAEYHEIIKSMGESHGDHKFLRSAAITEILESTDW